MWVTPQNSTKLIFSDGRIFVSGVSWARRAAVGLLPPGPALRLPPPRALQPSGASLPLCAVLRHRLPAHRHPPSARVLPTSALVLRHGQDHGLVPRLQHRLRQDVLLGVAAASPVRNLLTLRVAYYPPEPWKYTLLSASNMLFRENKLRCSTTIPYFELCLALQYRSTHPLLWRAPHIRLWESRDSKVPKYILWTPTNGSTI